MNKRTLALASSFLMSSAVAVADVSTSTTTAPNLSLGLLDKITASYVGYYHGFSLADPTTYQPTPVDSRGGGGLQDIDSFLSVAYKFTPDISLGPVLHMDLHPVGILGATMLDPYISLKHAKLINAGPFNMLADVRAYAPVSAGSQGQSLITAFRTSQFMSLDIPGTKLTLTSFTFLRGNIYGTAPAVADTRTDLEFYFAPALNYQITPKLAATLWADILDLTHSYGDMTWGIANMASQNGSMDIEPGINYDFSPNFSLNPYLNIFLSNPSLATTGFGMNIVAKFL